MKNNFTYDAEKHEYRLDGLLIPSVTQVLAPLRDFSGIPSAVLERKRELGKEVHELTAQYDMGILDPKKVPTKLLGYVRSWARFIEWAGLDGDRKILLIEFFTCSPRWRYGVTPDRLVMYKNTQTVIEIKTTFAISPIDALQTAAQAEAIDASRRFTVRLDEKGGMPEFKEWKEKTDFGTFTAALSIWNWRQRNGIASGNVIEY